MPAPAFDLRFSNLARPLPVQLNVMLVALYPSVVIGDVNIGRQQVATRMYQSALRAYLGSTL
jgi:hypothetical protein